MNSHIKAITASFVVLALALCTVSGATYSWWTDSESTEITVTTGSMESSTSGFYIKDVLSSKVFGESDSAPSEFSIVYDDVRLSESMDRVWWVDNDVGTLYVAGNPSQACIEIGYRVSFISDLDYRYYIGVTFPEGVEGSVLVKEVVPVGEEPDTIPVNEWVYLDDSELGDGVSLEVSYDVTITIDSLSEDLEGSLIVINNYITQFQNDVSIWDGKAAVAFTSEDAANNTLHITSASEFALFRDKVNANSNSEYRTYKVELGADLDLNGLEWTPITSFSGEFDGNGHSISNFKVDATKQNGGLFRTIEAGEGERVHDLIIEDVDATVGAYRFGTLANSVKGIVNDVTVRNVNVTTTDAAAWVGGMCAFMDWPWMKDCTVENMIVDASDGAYLIAGFSPILQKNSNMVFDNLDVKGFKVTVSDTTADGCGVGGLVTQTQRGWEDPKLINCDVEGIDIVATGNIDIGGFMAWPGGHTILDNCTTQGRIDATGVTGKSNFVGGFFGNLGWNADLGKKGHAITNCTADVDIVSGGAPAGGFVGSATNSNNNSMYAEFTNCSATGDVTNLNGCAGGFAGDMDRGVYTSCSASGQVSGSIAGGFVGLIKDVIPKYDNRYPAGTREYLVDEITIDTCRVHDESVDFVGKINDGATVTMIHSISTADELANKLIEAGSAGARDTFLALDSDIDLTGVSWTPIYVDGYHGADIVKITSSPASRPLFSKEGLLEVPESSLRI